ncbi:YceI family protein [Mannheimia varigena]|nr:YceI family protein [Mannheimia varigena]
MRFVSTKFYFADKKVTKVEGNLTLLGQTHPVTLKATKFNCYDSPMLKAEVCGGDFVTTIDRSQWGMNYLVDVGMTKDVEIAIQIEAAKQ